MHRFSFQPSSSGSFVRSPIQLEDQASTVNVFAVLSQVALASASSQFSNEYDNAIRIWHLETYACLANLGGHTAGISVLRPFPDQRLISGSLDCSIRIWNIDEHDCVAVLCGHEKGVLTLVVLSDGAKIVSASMDMTARVWVAIKKDNYECTHILRGHTNYVHALAMLVDGRMASSSSDGTLRVWDIDNGVEVTSSHCHSYGLALIGLPDGRLASETSDHIIQLLNITNNNTDFLSGHTDNIHTLMIVPDSWLLSGSHDHTVRVWNITSHQCVAIIRETECFAFLNDGRLMTVYDDTLHLEEIGFQKDILFFPPGLSEEPIPEKDISIESEELGKGACSSVYKGKWGITSINVAVKILEGGRWWNADLFNEFQKEVNILRSVRHTNIIQFYGIHISQNRYGDVYGLVMELMENGSLSDVLNPIKYSRISILHESDSCPTNIALPTIFLQRKSNGLFAYWSTQSNEIQNEFLPDRDINDILTLLPTPGSTTSNIDLIQKITLKYRCHSRRFDFLPWLNRLSIANDIISGLLFLHKKHNFIIHCDLKSANILINKQMIAKISDFGLSKIKYKNATMSTIGVARGTLGWMAPELLQPDTDGRCTQATDIYATGIILWEIAARALPYANIRDESEIKNRVIQNDREPIPVDIDLPQKYARLIERCWAPRPEDRPTTDQLARDIFDIYRESQVPRLYFEEFLRACRRLIAQNSTAQKLRCFISYCWGPAGSIRNDLQTKLINFKEHLEILGAEVFLDIQDLDSNINIFMQRINNCDAIFLIGTPALKKRLEEAGDNNLKIEFNHIKSHLNNKPKCLYPLFFQGEGDFDTVFSETMPGAFINQHNILVRDCRQKKDEHTDPTALLTYINSLSGAGETPSSPRGVIPSIYNMQGTFFRAYEGLREKLVEQLKLS